MKFLLLVLSCLGFVSVSAQEGGPIPKECNAGIVLYARGPQGIEFLLADHTPPSTRGWASFGGKYDPGETPAQTAARETEEETRGYFSREKLEESLKTCVPHFDGFFVIYFLEIDHIDPGVIASHPAPSQDKAFHERGPYRWVPFSEVRKALDSDAEAPVIDARHLPPDAAGKWFWKVWIANMRHADKAGALPK